VALNEPVAISLGFVRAYLVPGEGGCVLVDAGTPGQEDKIFAAMASYDLAPRDLRLIFITHAHGDHIGSLAAVAERSGAPVLAQRGEAAALASGQPLRARGLTAFGKLLDPFLGRLARAASGRPWPVKVVVDEELRLDRFGLRGSALHTPGHTAGSLSLLLDSGEAFVGDLCAKVPLLGRGSQVPFLGEDREAVYASWRRLLAAGAKRIYPDHSRPFPAEVLRRELQRAGRL
jgi:hydroxyacylglutathione hydrolase